MLDLPFKSRLAAALAIAEAAQVPRSLSAPPIYRLLWACGFKAVPPHFARVRSTIVIVFFVNLLFWGGTALLLAYVSAGRLVAIAINAVAGSAAFAIGAATYFRWSAWRHRFPAWAGLDPVESAEGI